MMHDLASKACMDLHRHDEGIPGGLDLACIDGVGGFGTAIDTLAAIKTLVFDEKKLSWNELLGALECNWEGKEAIRQMCLNAPKYGNGIEWVDQIGKDIYRVVLDYVRKNPRPNGLPTIVRIIPITFHVPAGKVTFATPTGRPAGEYLSEGISPAHGMDLKGPTVSMTSMARATAIAVEEKGPNLINMKFAPANLAGEAGTRRLMQILRTWCNLEAVARAVQRHQSRHAARRAEGPGEIPRSRGAHRRLLRVLRRADSGAAGRNPGAHGRGGLTGWLHRRRRSNRTDSGSLAMPEPIRRIAVSLGGGYVPGLAGVVRAVAQAAHRHGWEVVGLRDGFDGLLFPERYRDGGVLVLDPATTPGSDDEGSLLGTGTRNDPFRLQEPNEDGLIEEVDASDRVLQMLRDRGIDAFVAIVGGSAVTGSHAVAVMWKLSRKGLRCVCIPKSAENDLAATAHPYGYDSILSYAAESLRHIRIAARDQGRVALVEVPGNMPGGWHSMRGSPQAPTSC